MPRNSHEDDLPRMNARASWAGEAARLIEKAFVWEATVEGHDYWLEVVANLQEIAETYKDN